MLFAVVSLSPRFVPAESGHPLCGVITTDVQSQVTINALTLLTLNISTTRYSLPAKTEISMIVMISIWIGLIFPRTAPKEIKTVAVLKSAFIMLWGKERIH